MCFMGLIVNRKGPGAVWVCACALLHYTFVCDLPHCVSGVCGHTNHLCPKQASVQAQRQQPQCQCGGHQLPHASGSPPPKSQTLGIRITGEVAHMWDIQVLLEQHWPKKKCECFHSHSPSKSYFPWSCLPHIAEQPLLFSFPIVSSLCWELQMQIPKLLGFPNPCADPVWIQLIQIFCCESEQEWQFSAFWWQQCS